MLAVRESIARLEKSERALKWVVEEIFEVWATQRERYPESKVITAADDRWAAMMKIELAVIREHVLPGIRSSIKQLRQVS